MPMATIPESHPVRPVLPRQGRSILVLAVFLCLVLARLLFYSAQFARLSLQMDFAAYYIAGQAVDRGLTPYVNHVDQEPPLWDGVARYAHSRFLYPPLAGYMFVPLARLPYLAAKSLWTLLGLVCTGASLALTGWAIGFRRITQYAWMGIGIGTALFHPLLTHLERGQIDSLTLMLLMLSIALMLKSDQAQPGRPSAGNVAAGLLLALATLLKLHVGLILPFLVLRRRFTASAAYAAGLAVIALTSLVVAPALSLDYVQHQMPRISVYGELGTEAMRLAPEKLEPLLAGVPEGMTRLAGSGHTGTLITMREYFPFLANGTLVREIMPTVDRLGLSVSISQLSMALYGLLFGAFYLWLRRNRAVYSCLGPHRELGNALSSTDHENVDRDTRAIAEFLYWAMALIVIMMTAPATWVMNLVWLLPLCVVFAAETGRAMVEPAARPHSAALLIVWFTGLALAAVPDRIIGLWEPSIAYRIPDQMLYPWGWLWASRKYLVAQSLLLASIAPYVEATLTSHDGGSRRRKA